MTLGLANPCNPSSCSSSSLEQRESEAASKEDNHIPGQPLALKQCLASDRTTSAKEQTNIAVRLEILLFLRLNEGSLEVRDLGHSKVAPSLEAGDLEH